MTKWDQRVNEAKLEGLERRLDLAMFEYSQRLARLEARLSDVSRVLLEHGERITRLEERA